jgi:hypothetical protein
MTVQFIFEKEVAAFRGIVIRRRRRIDASASIWWMRRKKIYFEEMTMRMRLLLCVFVAMAALPAQAEQIRVFSTGVNANQELIPAATVDQHYRIATVTEGFTTGPEPVPLPTAGPLLQSDQPAVAVYDNVYPLGTYWVTNGPKSKWISPSPDTNGLGSGLYTYKTTFDLTGLDPVSAKISGSWAVDDAGWMFLNGKPVSELPFGWMFMQLYGLQVAPNAPSYTANHDFLLTSGFIEGINTLEFVVWNGGGGPTGLRVEVVTAEADLLIRQVMLDIKPGDDTNPVNLSSKGKIPVAILSSASFDATTETDIASLTFGNTGTEPSLAFCNNEDVNVDGRADLVCHFYTARAGFKPDSTTGALKGKTKAGIPMVGKDSVTIVPF